MVRTVYKVSPVREGTPLRRQDSCDMQLDEPGSPALLFSFDDSTAEMDDPTTQQIKAGAQDVVRQLQWLLESNDNDNASMLKLHVQLARPFLRKGADQHLDLDTLCDMLRRAGYTAKLHSQPGNALKGLRHQYIAVCLPDSSASGSSTHIVDPNFRDSFVVAHPTRRYSAILEALTPEVVASQACLRRAVTALSSELARSFTEQGSPVPPWRTQAALLSKWQLAPSSGAGRTQTFGAGDGEVVAAAAEGGAAGGMVGLAAKWGTLTKANNIFGRVD